MHMQNPAQIWIKAKSKSRKAQYKLVVLKSKAEIEVKMEERRGDE